MVRKSAWQNRSGRCEGQTSEADDDQRRSQTTHAVLEKTGDQRTKGNPGRGHHGGKGQPHRHLPGPDGRHGIMDRSRQPESSYSGWYNKGDSLLKLGRYKEALECYDKATKIHPVDTDAWYYKGLVLQKLGKDKESLKCYDKVIELDPEHPKMVDGRWTE